VSKSSTHCGDSIQRSLRSPKQKVNRRIVIIQLYKALGGGWKLTDAEFMRAN
jgi:hypothetical protein